MKLNKQLLIKKRNITNDSSVYKIGEVLKSLMREKNIDSLELSRIVNVPVPTINRLRSNQYTNPTLATLQPIANFFSVTIDQLIGVAPLRTNSSGHVIDKTKSEKTTLIPIDIIDIIKIV